MKPYTKTAVLFLALLAVVHVIRMALSWPVSVGGAAVPIWASAVAVLVTGGLAYLVWRENRS